MRTKHQIVISKDNEIVISCTRNIKFEERENKKKKRRNQEEKTKEFYVHGVNLCNLFLFMFSVLNSCLLWLDTEWSEGGMARHGFGSIF
jgi:hypothetical protein